MTFADMPEWVLYLIQGLALCLHLVFGAIIVSRTGRSSYWAFVTIIPIFYVLSLSLWAFAFCQWPKRPNA